VHYNALNLQIFNSNSWQLDVKSESGKAMMSNISKTIKTDGSRAAQDQIYSYIPETKKRRITIEPSLYPDTVSNRDILVLLIDVPEIKEKIAAFYD
jgi:hypothetical protein